MSKSIEEPAELALPVPISVNSIYRAAETVRLKKRGKRIERVEHSIIVKTAEAKAYQEHVGWIILTKYKDVKIPNGPLAFSVTFFLPNNVARDLDNLLKLFIDAVSKGLRFDDSRIIDLHAYKRYDYDNPRSELSIRSTA